MPAEEFEHVNEHIVIVTGSSAVPAAVVATIPASAIVLGVDGGLDVARAAGLEPSGLVGDLDSVSAEGLAWAQAHATIAQHPTDKDQTDTELALAFAAEMQPEHLTLIGGGDRLDHTIAAIGALGLQELTTIPILDAWWDGQHLDVIHAPGRRTLRLEPESIVSLLAIGARCENVGITGVRWPLAGRRLEPLIGLGISNEVTHPTGMVEVTVSAGVLTIFDVPAPLDSTTARRSTGGRETHGPATRTSADVSSTGATPS
jgi:thiamine pyrophosphokinase